MEWTLYCNKKKVLVYLLRYPRIVKMQCTKCMVHVYVECMTRRWTRARPGGGQKFHIFKIFRNSFRTGTCVAQMSTQQCFLSLFFQSPPFSRLFNASKRLLAAQASTRGHGAPAWMPSWRNCVLTGKFFPVPV